MGAYGAAVFLASFFPADPVDRFPPGTPLGMPTSISRAGLIHFACGICVCEACGTSVGVPHEAWRIRQAHKT